MAAAAAFIFLALGTTALGSPPNKLKLVQRDPFSDCAFTGLCSSPFGAPKDPLYNYDKTLPPGVAPSGRSQCISNTVGDIRDGVKTSWKKAEVSSVMTAPAPVEKIFYINTKSGTARLAHMKKELADYAPGVPSERFPAFEAEDIPNFDLKSVSSGHIAGWLKERPKQHRHIFAAIFTSNYKVLEHILKSDPQGEKSNKIYMVVEDDAKFTHKWQFKLEEILRNTPDNWDLLRIGFWGASRCEDKINDFVQAIQAPAAGLDMKDHFYSGNTGFLVRPKDIPKILSVLQKSPVGAIENAYMYPIVGGKPHEDSFTKIQSFAVLPYQMLIHRNQNFPSSRTPVKLNQKLEKTPSFVAEQKLPMNLHVSGTSAEGKARSAVLGHPPLSGKECIMGASGRDESGITKTNLVTKFKNVKKIVYISAQETGEREDNMQTNLARVDREKTKVERFQAIMGPDLDKMNLKKYSTGKLAPYVKSNYPIFTQKATAAIYVSHQLAMKKILNDAAPDADPDGVYMILEDDSHFKLDWKKKLHDLMLNTPDDWDLVKLGYWGERHCADKVNSQIFQAHGPTFSEDSLFYQGNTGYLVKLRSIPRIIMTLQQNDLQDADGILVSNGGWDTCDPATQPCINVYAAAASQMMVKDLNELGSLRMQILPDPDAAVMDAMEEAQESAGDNSFGNPWSGFQGR